MSPQRHALILLETLGSQVMGHTSFASSLRAGLGPDPELAFRFVELARLPPTAARLVGEVRGLRRLDADLQQTRWHLVQSERARRTIARELSRTPADIIGCLSHAIGLRLPGSVSPRPTVLFADVGMWPWREMAIWRPLRPWSRQAIGLSLTMERRALANASLVVAWSHWTAAGLRRRAEPANLIVLHPGIDLTAFRPRTRAPRPRPRILFVGGRFAAKGGNDLLTALEPMLGTEVDVDLVTSAPVAPRAGVRVHALGPGPELADLFAQSDLVALPTHGDAIPWVVLEAMASGTPVVASCVGAIPELLDGGGCGVLVPPTAPDRLRTAITRLLEDDGRRTELAQAARARCERDFDARRQTERLCERLLALPASRA